MGDGAGGAGGRAGQFEKDTAWGRRTPLQDGGAGSGRRGMQKAASEAILGGARQGAGMMREGSSNLLSAMNNQGTWDDQGGWRSSDGSLRKRASMERDASMVNLLNLVDPQSLVDKKPKPGEIVYDDQHSALSRRGVALVGGLSAASWYVLRLLLRDILKRGELYELHALSSIHSLAWVVFLFKKIGASAEDLPKYCSRALVASLGFYLHECWNLRGTILSNPTMLIHQASVAMTLSTILRSKGVAWLAAPIMSVAVPNLIQELLRLCGTIGLQPVRPEVRSLRLLWVSSFVASKLALIPAYTRSCNLPEMHQPNLYLGKLSYLVSFVLDMAFMKSALTDLSGFLRPSGVALPAALAYRAPLKGARDMANALVAATILNAVFGSYLTGPTAVITTLMSLRAGSGGRLRVLASLLCGAIALDKAIPQPKEMPAWMLNYMYIFRKTLYVFNWRTYPKTFLEDLPKDRHHVIGVTPHGLFPWGAGGVIVSCMECGYLPNFIGASVLGALPIAGRLLRYFGFREATRSEIRKCLEKPYPRNITIILPGGIREMFHAREDIEISASNLHGGFAELAKEGDAMLIPAYVYGCSQLYKVSRGALADFFQDLSRRVKVSVVLFSGRWGTLLPYSQEMACAMGEPIDTRLCASGKEAHKLFVVRLREAYDKYKAEFGWPDRELYFEGEDIPPEPQDAMDNYTALPTSNVSKL